MGKRLRFGLFVVVILSLTLCFASTGMSAAPSGDPIVIGYVGMVLSPGTRPCMAIQKVACQEINEAGGVLGRPLKYVIADNKGAMSLTVEGARRLLMEEKAKFVFVEGRTEICLAAQENSATMFKDYPHIMIGGGMGSELTARIFDDYDKYKFYFNDFDPEPAHYPQQRYFFGTMWPEMFTKAKGRRIQAAILWEDLEWTKQWQSGIGYMNMPPWEEMMEKEFNIDVVYSKKVKPRGTMYLPLLQQIAGEKADVILYISSWFAETESFVKQWADSAAREIPVMLYGGVSQTSDFWQMTGGKATGVLTTYMECRLPLTQKTVPFVEMAVKHKIPTQIPVHLAYADIYFIKKVIEKAGGVDDINKLIKAMETTEITYSLGKMAYETQKVKPYFHSRIRVDLSDPLNKSIPGVYFQPMAQFGKNGEIRYLGGSCAENELILKKAGGGTAADYRYPAELR